MGAATFDDEAVGALFDLDAEGAQVGDGGSDAIGLFDAQLLRVAQFGAALGGRGSTALTWSTRT